mgnify:CR=1 FL=1
MNRRAAIFTLLALPLGQYDVYATAPRSLAQAPDGAFARKRNTSGPALLTIDLAEWGGILVKWGAWQELITPTEIKQALETSQ